MSYRLILKEEAAKDAYDGFNWYENQQSGLGTSFFDELDRYFKLIIRHPFRFPQHESQRLAVVKKFPYKIVFDVNDDTIIVYAIYHDRRNPRKLAERKSK